MPRTLLSALALTCAMSSPLLAQNAITRTSAAAVGKPLSLEYSATAGNLYAMFLSGGPFAPLPTPWGTLHLNPLSLTYLYANAVPGSGVDTVSFGIPANPFLIGVCLGFQAFNANLNALSTNYVELCISAGIGTITVVEGPSFTATTGSVDVETVTNAIAGAPVSQGLGNVAVQGITHYGLQGFRQLVSAGSTTVEQADLEIDRLNTVCQDLRNPGTVHMSLPNGFDLYVLRDVANPKTFFLASLSRATGVMTKLTNSTFTDVGVASPTPTSMFRPQFAFSADGGTAICVVHDSTNTPVNNVGPPDKLLVVKTDPAQTFSNGFNVFDASPAAGPDSIHTTYNGSLRIGFQGHGLVEGEEPSGVSGAAAMWSGPTDGSAQWTRVTVPNTGTGNAFYWSYSVWRQDAAHNVDVFLSGGSSASSTTDMDVMAITNLGVSAPVVTNITAFAVPTQVQTFGNSTLGTTNIRAALAPDGTRVAITLGANTVASPGGVAVVRTNGADAGTVTAFTTGQFDATVIGFWEVWWLTNSTLLFTAGSTSTAVDYYVYDVGLNTITNLTRTTDGSFVAPFCQGGTHTGTVAVRGSFLSENGSFYYFARGYTSTTLGLSVNWKGINTTTSALFDVTGNEFSGGTAPSLRPISTTIYTWFPRRHDVTNELFFACGTNSGVSATYQDDQIFRFNPETGGLATQVTANTGSGTTTTVQRIQDLALQTASTRLAYAQGPGTAATTAEDLYVLLITGGAPTKVSVTPSSGGQGIQRGSVYFVPAPLSGIVWAQGTNSRTAPTIATAAYWNHLGGGAPLRLTASPSATAKVIGVLNTSPLNP